MAAHLRAGGTSGESGELSVLRRIAVGLGGALLLVWFVLTGVFVLLRLLPGTPGATYEDPRVPAAQRERLRSVYGLDRPLVEQYGRWLAGVAGGEWGYSFSQQRPVTRILAETAPATLLLSGTAFLLEIGLGLSLGVAAAARAGSPLDRLVRVVSLSLWATPSFWFALLLFLAFTIRLPLLPAGGMRTWSAGGSGGFSDLVAHLALPAIALGLPAAAAMARFVRATMLEQMAQPHYLSARARGLSPARVLLRHALRPGLAPIAQLCGLSLASILSGTLAVEVVFAWPGLGRASYDALVARDYPLLLAGTALTTLVVVLGSVAAELLQAALDPRLREGRLLPAPWRPQDA